MCIGGGNIHGGMLHGKILANRGVLCYNLNCHTVRNGALFVSSADVVNKIFYWVKFPVLLSNRSADCVTTSASNTGNFVMTIKTERPCNQCGAFEWNDRGKCKACARKWARDNRHKADKWKRENPEKARESNRKSHQKNKHKGTAYQKEYRARNKDRLREYDRNYRRANPEYDRIKHHRRRARLESVGGSYTKYEWEALCNQYSNRCLRCGREGRMTPDHVIPLVMGGSNDITNIQPLCGPCNYSKQDKTTDYRTKPGLLRWIQEKLL